MEKISIKLNDAETFDSVLKNSLADGGDLEVITKDGATVNGQPAVMLRFSVEVDGQIKTAQTVTTLKMFVGLLQVLKAKYE